MRKKTELRIYAKTIHHRGHGEHRGNASKMVSLVYGPLRGEYDQVSEEVIKGPASSFRRKPESSLFRKFWPPAFAGVTLK